MVDSVPARGSSFLPSIKCSNCNVDIPISQMGDHLCSTTSKASQPPIKHHNVVDGPFAPGKKPAMTPKLDQPPPPRLDTIGESTAFSSVRLPFTSNGSSASSSRSVSPVQVAAGRKSPYQLPPRSQTTPLPSRPPSDDVVLPQDNAFPTFPLPRSRCVTPTIALEEKPAFSRTQTEPIRPQAMQFTRPAENEKSTETANVMQEVDADALRSINGTKADVHTQDVKGHRKNASMSSSKDFSRRISSGTAKFHMPRPSASSSVYTRNRSTSTVSGTSRLDWDTPEVPSVPAFPAREGSIQNETIGSPGSLDGSFDFGLEKPKEDFSFPKLDEPMPKPAQEPSPYSHKPRPSVTAAMAPLHSIGSSSSFKPSRSIRARKASIAAAQAMSANNESTNGRDDQRLQDAPPVPSNVPEPTSAPSNPTHTLHESTSSNGSYSSGARSGSSRSSPPLQESPRRQKLDAFQKSPSENSFEGFQFGIESGPQMPAPSFDQKISKNQPDGYDPYPIRAPSLSAQPTLPNILPPSPTIRQDSVSSTSPDDYMIKSNQEQNSYSDGFHLSPTVSRSPPRSPPIPSLPNVPPQRARPPDKGPCRGCGEPIKGKSVSSADGRLTGRYHKGCFVCTTCSNPFQTADFYVIRNHPYCARHYHELNNSLCQGCNRGIEGQYLETETYRKFHSYCFTCQECHKILRDDYFEWRGRTLCEQHAFKAANQPSSSLGIGGRKFPEKRSTKLMMMI